MPSGGFRPRKPGAIYGRPSKGDRVEIKARLPRAIAEQIQAMAADLGTTPSEIVTRMVVLTLHDETGD